ncbi:MAG: ATP-dependent DNA ligase [Chloroflexota bacterium]
MTSPVRPPIAPMLARLTRELPLGSMSYEPKWDGFRCIAFVDVDGIDLRSRHDRPLARYFPELVAGFEEVRALRAGSEPSFVADGEIVLAEPSDHAGDGFSRLMTRLHPAATRVDRLRRESPARFVAFDALADGSLDLRERPFVERRAALIRIVPDDHRVVTVTPSTRAPGAAVQWLTDPGPGIDGVVAKPDDLPYQAGRRSMIKVKQLRTADCVLAGIRATDERGVTSLLLGLYDESGALRHVGSVSQLKAADRRELLVELRPLVVPLAEHPWRDGFTIGASPLGRLPGSAARWMPDMEHDWLPLRPERVVEVGFDQVDGDRFRHPARFIRWRPDRLASTCMIDQILPGRSSGEAGDRVIGELVG